MPERLRRLCLAAVLMMIGTAAMADVEAEEAERNWQELPLVLPAPPRQTGLQGFEVSAVAEGKFYVDLPSISVGTDGIVRYTLVVDYPGGSRNVSYEGMRCEKRDRRAYAFGRRDGSWSQSRRSDWVKVQEVTANRHYAELFLEFFCPGGVMVDSADEARDALRRGGHPRAQAGRG